MTRKLKKIFHSHENVYIKPRSLFVEIYIQQEIFSIYVLIFLTVRCFVGQTVVKHYFFIWQYKYIANKIVNR